MTELTAMTMAADVPQHWKTAGSIRKKANVCVSRARTMDRTNQANPTAFADQEATAPAGIIRPTAL
ncbi:hypothetical protein [Bradyrhizobium sp. 604_D8_N2_3]|jgi:hypothetical protein|uniref:hypothetical protein n=1 Tax=Bradyrhizobium TaxID=374 RepID=UPI003F25746D